MLNTVFVSELQNIALGCLMAAQTHTLVDLLVRPAVVLL